MDKRKFLIFGGILLAAIALSWGIGPAQAAQSTETQTSRNTDAIIQRRLSRITPNQRQAAAARLRTGSGTKARRLKARAAADQAAAARITALREAKSPNSATRRAEARMAAAREARVRLEAVNNAGTTGGTNE